MKQLLFLDKMQNIDVTINRVNKIDLFQYLLVIYWIDKVQKLHQW